MNRISLFLSVVVLAFFLISGTGLAQNHHPDGAAKGEAISEAGAMPAAMQQKMMGGQKGMKGGMMHKDMMAKCKQHGGMMGKGMMQGGMMGKGMMQHNGMMAMMQDPIFKTLHRTGCPGFLLMSTDKLTLSEKQINNLKKIKADFHKTAIKNKASIDVAKIELKEILDTASPDFGQVKNKITQISSLQQKLRLDFLNVVIQARKLLTAEQLKTLRSLANNCCKGMGGGDNGMMGQGMMMK